MTEPERLLLAASLADFKMIGSLLTERSLTRPRDPEVVLALARLERTCQLQMYVLFEQILRDRLPGVQLNGIANAVQLLVREEETYDPAKALLGLQTGIKWHVLLSRDRNALAHGTSRPLALRIGPTHRLLESFLNLLGRP